MASRTEGIALLSMYNDEEEEDDQPLTPSPPPPDHDADAAVSSKDATALAPAPPPLETSPAKKSSPAVQSGACLSSDEDPEYYKSVRSPTPSPLRLMPQSQPSQASLPVSESQGAQRVVGGSLMIVDYAHDEMAMSPENQDGEITSSDRVLIGTELQISEGTSEVTTPQGTVQVLSPSSQSAPLQSSDLPEHKSEAIDYTGTEPEVTQEQVVTSPHEEMQIDPDPLNNFLPPSLATKCPEELQEKINKFLAYKRAGKSFNADLRNRKDYRNPDFLQHAVRYQDIDQIGSCFSKDVFDPHGYDKSDYFDEIEAEMKRELERKEQERKKSQKVDFVAGGTQPGTITPALKMIGTQFSVASAAATTGLQSFPATVIDSAARDIRQNKKSKWDKVDGDAKNPLHGGAHDNLSAVGVHAAHLSAANAGSGYTAFAQQKRREAEEKKSSERKFDKRS